VEGKRLASNYSAFTLVSSPPGKELSKRRGIRGRGGIQESDQGTPRKITKEGGTAKKHAARADNGKCCKASSTDRKGPKAKNRRGGRTNFLVPKGGKPYLPRFPRKKRKPRWCSVVTRCSEGRGIQPSTEEGLRFLWRSGGGKANGKISLENAPKKGTTVGKAQKES